MNDQHKWRYSLLFSKDIYNCGNRRIFCLQKTGIYYKTNYHYPREEGIKKSVSLRDPIKESNIAMSSAKLKSRCKIIEDPLKGIPLFAGMNDEKTDLLARSAVKKSFTKNQMIIHESASCDYLYIVCSGMVKVINCNEDGNEQILAIHNKGDSFGELAVLDGKTSPAEVVAMTNCEIWFLSKTKVEEHVLNDVQALRRITLTLCSQLRESWVRLKIIQFDDAEQRIRATLNLLAGQNGKWTSDGILITIKLTQNDIGAYAAVVQETVCRTLKRLVEKGEVALTEKKLILLKPLFFRKN